MKPDISVTFTGLKFTNPFLLSSAPPTESDSNIMRAFDAGWGGVVTKTIGLHPVTNVAGPKTKFLRSTLDGQLSMQKRPETALHSSWNWELISDKPLDWWIPKIAGIKKAYPDRMLIASIMAGSGNDKELAAWQTLAKACQDEGADAFELNLSCPHMDRKDMGSNIGKDQAQVSIVTEVVKEVAKVPVWAKLTPSTTDIVEEADAALRGGADAIVSSNTFPSLPLIDPETLDFEMNVDGLVSSGGLGGPAILPLSLAKMSQLTNAFPDHAFSGIGGVSTFSHALNYLLLGCGTVQVCTAAMLDRAIGPNVIKALTEGMQQFMEKRGYRSIEDFRGMRRGNVVVHSKIRRPEGKEYHGGHDAEGYATERDRRRQAIGPSGYRQEFRRTNRRRLFQPALERGPRAHVAGQPDVVHLSHRGALDRHERGDHHLHARLGTDAARHDVVAGAHHHPPRQRHRPHPDDPQRARRHEVRRVVSRVVPCGVRRQRRQRAGDPARDRSLRLVRHPDLDRRARACRRCWWPRGAAGRMFPAASGFRSRSSGWCKSRSSFAGSKASRCSRAGRRRYCSAAAWRC